MAFFMFSVHVFETDQKNNLTYRSVKSARFPSVLNFFTNTFIFLDFEARIKWLCDDSFLKRFAPEIVAQVLVYFLHEISYSTICKSTPYTESIDNIKPCMVARSDNLWTV